MLHRGDESSPAATDASCKTDEATSPVPCSCKEPDRDAVVYCRHFQEVVPDHVCVTFRARVGDTGRRACSGCVIDAVLYRPQESIRDCILAYNA